MNKLWLIMHNDRPVCATWTSSVYPTRVYLDDSNEAPLYGRWPAYRKLDAEEGYSWRRTTHAHARKLFPRTR